MLRVWRAFFFGGGGRGRRVFRAFGLRVKRFGVCKVWSFGLGGCWGFGLTGLSGLSLRELGPVGFQGLSAKLDVKYPISPVPCTRFRTVAIV